LEYLLHSETAATAETDTQAKEVTVYRPSDRSSILSNDSNVSGPTAFEMLCTKWYRCLNVNRTTNPMHSGGLLLEKWRCTSSPPALFRNRTAIDYSCV